MNTPRIEIKICGLTSPELAVACAAAGADAIGLVFHPVSPRNLRPEQARAIAAALSRNVARVGVFVAQTPGEILRIADLAALDAVQLCGSADAAACDELIRHGLHVVQVLRSTGAELLAEAQALPLSVGVLVECGAGAQLGGIGKAWNWADAAVLRGCRPFAIAGGLDAATVGQAIAASGAPAVDVSSHVERAPGIKDLDKVAAFVAAVRTSGARSNGRVFKGVGITS